MLNTTKSTSVNGNSSIEGKTVVTFSANIPSSGEISLSKRIQNKKTYLENQTNAPRW